MTMEFLIWLFQGPTLPGSHAIERFLIEDNLHRIIHTFHKERKDWYVLRSEFVCDILRTVLIVLHIS